MPRLTKFPKTATEYSYVRNSYIQKNFRLIVLDRLDSCTKMMETSRWCSLHEAPVPHIDSVKIDFKGNSKTEKASFTPVPVNIGIQQGAVSVNKGVTVDRYNIGFLNSLDSCEDLALSLSLSFRLTSYGFSRKVVIVDLGL